MQLAVLLVLPALANGSAGTISVEPHPVDVMVGSIFTVDIQTTGPPNFAIGIHFTVTWDPSLTYSIEVTYYVAQLNCHFSSGFPKLDQGTFELEAITNGPYLTGVATWATIKFRCEGAGVSSISIESSSHWILVSVDYPFSTVTDATCNQRQPAPSNPYQHVGGEMFTANKLAVLSPYLALIGTVAVGAIVAKRKWA
jgi:hypothetical protein